VSSFDGGMLPSTELVCLMSPTEKGRFKDGSAAILAAAA